VSATAARSPQRAAPASTLAGNPALLKKLAKLGIRTPFDLVLHLPLRYEDETRVTPVAEALEGAPVQIEGRVERTEIVFRPRRQLVSRVRDASGLALLRFFNFYPSQQKALAEGVTIRAFGELRPGFFGAEMVHPRFRVLRAAEPLPDTLTAIYPTTAGVSQYQLRPLIERALRTESLADTLPEATRASLGLCTFAEAVGVLHHPPPDVNARALGERTHPAWRRVKFDELLAQQLSMRMHYRARQQLTAPALPAGGKLVQRLLERLPFKLTRAQIRVWNEIAADLARPHPMNRLLQGDVGSGKTIVAALAALRAVENGYQAAVMAPTEILAEQHHRKLVAWLAPLGVEVAWLSGGQKKSERNAAGERIAAGEIGIAIGTHALFQDQVRFARLGLAVVDEQHRFGVRQRLALRDKATTSAEGDAHILMMSATPIPRTLAMSYYADLEVSAIDELPPGRTPIVTKLISDARRDEVVRRIREACAQGRQVYWVCPLIEESESLDLQTAIDTHATLAGALPELAVGLVHGRLPSADKAQVMADFIAGRVQVLVATTVIEVGVDVPNASLMVIEHAERFGLAQLHQLRGRVGRGAAQSACILLYQHPLPEGARARLRVIYEHADGFDIAAEDLRLRGPGELLGARQSGVPLLRFADLAHDQDLLAAARDAAELMLAHQPDAASAHVVRWMAGRADLLKA
jgi:ATP-dependent DNA helicase RecG